MFKFIIVSSLVFASFSGFAEERIDLGFVDCVEQFNPTRGKSRMTEISNVRAYVMPGQRGGSVHAGMTSVPLDLKRLELRGDEIVSTSRRASILGDTPTRHLGRLRPVNSYSVFHQLVIDERQILMTSQWDYANGEVLSSWSVCTFKTPQDVQQIYEDISSL